MDYQRIIIFLIFCIGSRLSLVYITKNYVNLLPYIGIITLIISIGFMSIYLFGLRKTGIEVGGNVIYWNNMRPVHSLLYFIFSILAFNKNKYSWLVLLLDALVGVGVFTREILH